MAELSERFDDAMVFASRLHRQQVRKGMETPYIAHLMSVSALVIENGGDEDQAIGALLHDAAEDQGGQAILSDIRVRYGEGVAQIVSDCTDSWIELKPAWRPRKELYLASLPAKAHRSLLVSLADKTHNARSIVMDRDLFGDAVWERSTGGREGTLWYYQALSAVFQSAMPTALSRELDACVRRMLI